MDVYPRRRTVWMAIIGFGFFSFVFVIAALAALDGGDVRSDWWLLIGLVLIPWGLRRAVRQLGHPPPWAHLDEAGIDCALGHVPWSNIANVSVAWRWIPAGRGSHPSRRLLLELRDPAQSPAPVAGKYLTGMPFGGPGESDGLIRLPLWRSKEKVLADVGRCYATG